MIASSVVILEDTHATAQDRIALPLYFSDEAHTMLHTIVCLGCERVLDEASNALRRHASEMHTAFDFVRKGVATKEQVSDFRDQLVASFNEAQSAWDAYREHLAEHGPLPPSSKLP